MVIKRSSTFVVSLAIWMNILHLVTTSREPSPILKRLQEECKDKGNCPLTLSKEEIKQRLSPLQYRVTQEKGTERAFSGKYVHYNEEGVYTCVVCGHQLFSSDTKFDSNSGWPSFSDVMSSKSVVLKEDTSLGMNRVEVTCAWCGAHLGHMFTDGPLPTGLRYCINSAALAFTGQRRIEAKCSQCGAHLGHVFDDGPKPTGVRYCVNSASLDFKKHTTV